MCTHLRRFSVFVDEPDPGVFYWVLHESTDDANVWLDIKRSSTSYLTWTHAFDHGIVELFRSVPDEHIGPQSAEEDENVSPIDSHRRFSQSLKLRVDPLNTD